MCLLARAIFRRGPLNGSSIKIKARIPGRALVTAISMRTLAPEVLLCQIHIFSQKYSVPVWVRFHRCHPMEVSRTKRGKGGGATSLEISRKEMCRPQLSLLHHQHIPLG